MAKILKFYSPQCAPCKALSDKLFELGVETTDVNIAEDSQSVLLSTYQVRKVPTLIRLEEGEPTTVMVGYTSVEELKKFLKI